LSLYPACPQGKYSGFISNTTADSLVNSVNAQTASLLIFLRTATSAVKINISRPIKHFRNLQMAVTGQVCPFMQC